jgi:hypothetical protein
MCDVVVCVVCVSHRWLKCWNSQKAVDQVEVCFNTIYIVHELLVIRPGVQPIATFSYVQRPPTQPSALEGISPTPFSGDISSAPRPG